MAAAVTAAEAIGALRYSFGKVDVILLPFVLAFLGGLVLNPNVLSVWRPVMGAGAGARASRLVMPAVMPLVVLLCAQIGPNVDALTQACARFVAISLLVFLGTFLGSALIAQCSS